MDPVPAVPPNEVLSMPGRHIGTLAKGRPEQGAPPKVGPQWNSTYVAVLALEAWAGRSEQVLLSDVVRAAGHEEQAFITVTQWLNMLGPMERAPARVGIIARNWAR